MGMNFHWNRPVEAIEADYTGDRAQLFLANEAKRLMEPYVPALNMGLSRNVRVYVEGGRGIVHYLSSHARYQYGGKVMVSKRPGVKGSAKIIKQPVQPLHYTGLRHPLATSGWDKAMITARGDDLVRAMQDFIGGTGR